MPCQNSIALQSPLPVGWLADIHTPQSGARARSGSLRLWNGGLRFLFEIIPAVAGRSRQPLAALSLRTSGAPPLGILRNGNLTLSVVVRR